MSEGSRFALGVYQLIGVLLFEVWDMTGSEALVEMREHEKRVWCVDFSLQVPMKLARVSDDGAVELWNINQAIQLLHLLLEAWVPSERNQT